MCLVFIQAGFIVTNNNINVKAKNAKMPRSGSLPDVGSERGADAVLVSFLPAAITAGFGLVLIGTSGGKHP